MRSIRPAIVSIVGAAVATIGVASAASANCVDLQPKAAPGKQALSFRAAGAVGTPRDDQGAPIVGLWQFTFTSSGNNHAPFNIPDGAILDMGFAQWHSDGTEIMNSSRDPVTGSFCLGTWASEGHQTYRLNHFALSWDNTGKFCTPQAPATNCMVGTANIKLVVTIDPRGDNYEGSVTIDQYDTDNHLMFRLGAHVTAHRIDPE